MDSALYDGYSIPPYYDSLIAKLIVHGRDRPEALARLNRALGELIVDGIDTTVPLFHALLQEPDIQTGRLHDPLAGRLACTQRGLRSALSREK
jgi:acetyl-CoA carboxylase biotin carboxylase subunit